MFQKNGESEIKVGDVDQVLDYALDLKNFHKFVDSRQGGSSDYRGSYIFLRGTYTHKNLDFTKDVLAMREAKIYNLDELYCQRSSRCAAFRLYR